MNKDNLIPSLKTNKILLDEAKEIKIKKFMKLKIDISNCLALYHLSNIFKPSNSSTVSKLFIERCFPTIAESREFLEFDHISVIKILSSSNLRIDSELQVFNAADRWLSYDLSERSKYAKELLSKVRLSLLSTSALYHILENNSLSVFNECASSIKEVLWKKQHSRTTNYNITRRYCNQTDFDVAVCGSMFKNYRFVTFVKSLYKNNNCEVNDFAQRETGSLYPKIVWVKGKVFAFGPVQRGIGERSTLSVSKYSSSTNSWELLSEKYEERENFSFCSFINSIYIIGGDIMGRYTATCVEFCMKMLKWKKISEMSQPRNCSACSVFEGRIFVSGGYFDGSLNIVEAYDHVGNTWENMPNMIENRFGHKSVAVKNKLFIVGGINTVSFEVYDSNTENFSLLKEPQLGIRKVLYEPMEALTIGRKIFVFKVFMYKTSVLIYDLDKNEWSEKKCKAKKNAENFSFAKLPVEMFK